MNEITLPDLPPEIIGEIINKNLSIKDFINLGLLSKKMNRIYNTTNYMLDIPYKSIQNVERKERFKKITIRDLRHGMLKTIQPWHLVILSQALEEPGKIIIPESVVNLCAINVVVEIDPIRNSGLTCVDFHNASMIGKLPKSINKIEVDSMDYEFESLSNVKILYLWELDYRLFMDTIIQNMTNLEVLSVVFDCEENIEIFCIPDLPSIKELSLCFGQGKNVVIDLKSNKTLKKLKITTVDKTEIINPPIGLEEYSIILYSHNPYAYFYPDISPQWNKSFNISAKKVFINAGECIDYLPDERVKELIIQTSETYKVTRF